MKTQHATKVLAINLFAVVLVIPFLFPAAVRSEETSAARPNTVVVCADEINCTDDCKRGKAWYGSIPSQSGDEKFQRIYVQDGTLYHEDGSEVALWGVNFQSAMAWEWWRSRRSHGRWKFDPKYWKSIVDRSFDEIQLMGCDVIRIHLCPGDLADGQGKLIENEWLDMLDYTMAQCYRRGIYINFALLNHLGGKRGQDAILSLDTKEHKWEAMVVPEKIRATENYIRQLVNRRNPYDRGRPYKENPAWIIAELMNEPTWPKQVPSKSQFPDGMRTYEAWLAASGKQAGSDAWTTFKTESIEAYIDRFDQLLYTLRVPAIPCWNLFWSQGPRHQGWESYDAAAKSTVPIISFSTYPGQSDSGKSPELSDRNYLPYLERSYHNRDWQGWLQEDRFKGRKATIVYEYETWHNQSTYMYPAMAKYFRAQGAQVATMWTYYLDEKGWGLPRTHSHNLNVVTTPRKAASFLVAGQIFKQTPRYTPYQTTEADYDRFGNAALSFPLDLSAYADDDLLIHSGELKLNFVKLPRIPKKISGYGSSPFITYQGKGIYFLEAVFADGKFSNRWKLKVMPHAAFDSEGQSVVNTERSFPFTLRNEFMKRQYWDVYRIENGRKIRVPTQPPSITFDAKPGDYEIIKKSP